MAVVTPDVVVGVAVLQSKVIVGSAVIVVLVEVGGIDTAADDVG